MIMYLLWQLEEGKIPDVPYIMDSPMGGAFDIFFAESGISSLEDCIA
jgi:metallo-beta-lactamase family protein